MSNPIKSLKGRKCLTKCYPKGTLFVHPIVLSTRIDLLNDVCGVDPIYEKNQSGEMEIRYEDKCRIEDNYVNDVPNEIETLLLHFYFNSSDFLGNIYDIYSFDDAIDWTLENSYLPFDTIKRVHNCAWKSFGQKGISLKVMEYYYNLIKTKWIKDYAKNINKKFSTKIIINDDSGEKKNNFETSLIPFKKLASAINQFIHVNENEWDNIESYYRELKNYIYQYIENDLKKYSENIVK